jgi:hypothetical protein
MTVQSINIGTIANDGTGDNLRVAFEKVNQNFLDLDDRFSFTNSVENLGSGSGVFYSKENNILYFKSLVAGSNIALSTTDNEITINSNESFTIQADSDSVNIAGTSKSFGIKGVGNVNAGISSNDIQISLDPTGLVALDTAPALGGNLDAGNFSITNVTGITASTFTGNLVGTVNGIGITSSFEDLNLGGIVYQVTTSQEYVIATLDLDYGTFTAPGALNSDFGSIVS